jgi:hypothetical protein
MKLMAVLCVLLWTGFWAFRYLALSAQYFSATQITVAAVIAFAGLISGVFSYIRLCQHFLQNYQRGHSEG